LGYLINELNRDDFLPFEEPARKLNLSTYLPFTIMFAILILGTLFAISFYKLNVKRRKTLNELSIFK
jgi:hypothetical protein